jgi:amidase
MADRPDRMDSYVAALTTDLRGLRIGVVRDEGYFGYNPATDALAEAALRAFEAAGAELVDPVTEIGAVSHNDEMTVLCHEFKAGLDAYLAGRWTRAKSSGPAGLTRTLVDVIAFNEEHSVERLDVFPQDVLIRAAATDGIDDPTYLAARAANHRITREDGIDAVCLGLRLDALVAPTMSPAWPIDHVTGDNHAGSAWGQAAVAGYPSISLPIGEVQGLPVGLAIWGRAWTEATLIRIASAVEDQLNYRPMPSYRESVGLFT